jgi:hypothetical protein
MNDLTTKIRAVEQDVAAEKGSLNFFALLEREDLSDRWDVVVSASWAKHDMATLRYLADALKRHLTPSDMVRLARMVVLDAAEDPIKSLTETYDVEHGQVELNDPERFGLPVKHGYIITSRSAA